MNLVIPPENPFIGSSDCPICTNREPIEVWTVLDIDQHPELAYKFMNGMINFFKCSNCGYAVPFEYIPLVIHDSKNKQVSIYVPNLSELSENERSLVLNELMKEYITSIQVPLGENLFKPRIIDNFHEIMLTLWGENMFATHPKASESLRNLLLKLILLDNAWCEASVIIQNPILSTIDTVNILKEWSRNEESYGNLYGSLIIDKECELLLAFIDENVLEDILKRSGPDLEIFELIKNIRNLTDFEKTMFCDLANAASDQEIFVDAIAKIIGEIDNTRRLADFPRAISLCHFVSKILPIEREPQLWASVRGTLGVLLMETPIGDKSNQLDDAIKYFHDILSVYTFDGYPKEWAKTHSNLGSIYNQRIIGNKSDNIELAIGHFEKALDVRIDIENDDLAASLGGLGNSYLDRILGDRRKNQEKGIQLLEKAISIQSIEINRDWWHATVNNLSLAYLKRLEGNPKDNIEQALKYTLLGLDNVDQVNDSERWARIMCTLGDIYSERIAGNKSDNIEKALSCYQDALSILTSDYYNLIWGNIQLNYATTLINRITGTPKENTEQAMLLYEEILENVDVTYDPDLIAKVYLNYGGSLRKYSSYSNKDGEEIALLYKAIDCYSKVLELYSNYDVNPAIWGSANYHLALVYKDLGKYEGQQIIHKAISYTESALTVYTKNTYPREWANTAFFLGSVHHDLMDIEKAIEYTIQALDVHTLELYPYHWAMAQHNLGNYFQDRMTGVKEENIRRSKEHYINALKVFDSCSYPEDALQSNIRLGSLAFDSEDWKLAYNCFDSGICALNTIRLQSTLDSWFETIQRNIAIYSHAIIVSCKLQKFSKAFEYIEASKSRKFLSELAITDFYIPSSIPVELIKAEDHLQKECQLLREQLETCTSKSQIALRDNLRDNTHLLDDLYKKINKYSPDYVDIRNANSLQEKDINAFLNQLDQGTTVISIFDQPPDSILLFCWKANEVEPIVLNIPLSDVEIMSYLANILNNIYERSSTEPYTLGWKEFSSRIVTSNLSKIFDETKKLIFLPFGIWYLFPLHLLLWRGKPLIESFPVSFSPSLTVLSRTRSRRRFGNMNISSIGYVDDSTMKEEFEGEAKFVADLFGETAIISESATVNNVIEYANQSKNLHISSHGVFDIGNPLSAGLVLSDGILTAQKVITDIHLPGSFVCLSACMTAVTTFERGDERTGLIRAFLYAGASSVLSSMWSVNARATRELMEKFYFYIRQGIDRDVALQQACLDLKSKPGMEHPYYWAPFILYGDWRNEV